MKFIIISIISFILFSCFFTETCVEKPQELYIDEYKSLINHSEIYYNIDLYFGKSTFSAAQIEAISRAAEEWNSKTNHIVNVSIKSGIVKHHPGTDSIIILPLNENHPIVKYLDQMISGEILGLYNYYQSQHYIYIVPSRLTDIESFQQTITHELGHSIIGPGHVEFGYGLMNPTNAGSNCLTRNDLEMFCYKYGCDVDELNYCDVQGVTSKNYLILKNQN